VSLNTAAEYLKFKKHFWLICNLKIGRLTFHQKSSPVCL